MAKAIEFYNRLKGYDNEVIETGMSYYGYSNGTVDIHHKNNNRVYYTLYENYNSSECVAVHVNNITKDKFISLDSLHGNDFELYNPVQILRSGYIVIESDIYAKVVIGDLYKYIYNYKNNESDVPYPLLCGDVYSYNKYAYNIYDFQYQLNNIEVRVSTIQSLFKENINRSYYSARPFPYIKNMNSKSSIYISFSAFIRNQSEYDNRFKETDTAKEYLLKYLNDIYPDKIKYKWIECKSKYPVYY